MTSGYITRREISRDIVHGAYVSTEELLCGLQPRGALQTVAQRLNVRMIDCRDCIGVIADIEAAFLAAARKQEDD